MSEIITKEQLKQLIQGIIREADASRSLTNIQRAEEIIQSLIAKGAKNNRSFRRYASNLRYKAKQADADIVRGEVEQSLAARKRLDKRWDHLGSAGEPEPEPEVEPFQPPPIPYTPEDWIKWSGSRKYASRIPPETRAKMSASAKARKSKKQLPPQPPIS